MDPSKLDILRRKIKEIQEHTYCSSANQEKVKASEQVKEQLNTYKEARSFGQPSFVYLTSPSGRPFIQFHGQELDTEYGKCFFRKKTYIKRIGNVDISDYPECLHEAAMLDAYGTINNVLVKGCLYLDIETTSMESGAGNCAYIIGLGYFDEGCFVVEQYFMRDFDEEASMLSALASRLKNFRTLLSYNGKVFDINVLQNRATLNRISICFDELYHIDILQLYRKLFGRSMKRLNLVNLEKELLGIERIDDIPSNLVPEVYYQYLQRGYSELLEHVFEHNAQDIASLAGLSILLERALRSPSDYSEIAGYIYYAMGKLQKRKKMITEAKKSYELALSAKILPEIYAKICAELTRIYIGNQDYESASKLWLKLASSYPEVLRTRELKKLAIHFEHYDKDFTKAFHFAVRGSDKVDKCSDFEKRIERILKKTMTRLAR